MRAGVKRLHETIHHLIKDPDYLKETFKSEKKGWDLFYEILNNIENGINKGDPFAAGLREKAETLVKACKVSFSH